MILTRREIWSNADHFCETLKEMWNELTHEFILSLTTSMHIRSDKREWIENECSKITSSNEQRQIKETFQSN